MSIPKLCRTTLAAGCTLAGAAALWHIATDSEAAGAWEGVILMGGLGLVPLHAVPYERRMTWERLRAGWWTESKPGTRALTERTHASAEGENSRGLGLGRKGQRDPALRRWLYSRWQREHQ